jgi:RNA polymerase sigma factor (sigma-70 family)
LLSSARKNPIAMESARSTIAANVLKSSVAPPDFASALLAFAVDSPLDHFDVTRLHHADAAAWREFVRAAAPRLRAIISRTLAPAGRAADVPDVLQDLFARLCRDDFRLLRTFDPKRGRLPAWLGVLTARTAVDHLRKIRVAPESIESLPESADLLKVPPTFADETSLALPSDLISPQQELILRLTYEDDLEVPEIAALLRTQPQTVRSQRHKALERLRAFLAKRTFF